MIPTEVSVLVPLSCIGEPNTVTPSLENVAVGLLGALQS